MESNKKTVRSPDWRNPDDYAFKPGFWTEKQFYAWQFIRRNAEYRKDWERELQHYLEKKELEGFEDLDINDPWFFIAPQKKSTVSKWGLCWLCNPDVNSPYIIFERQYGDIQLSRLNEFHLGTPIDDIEKIKPLNVPDGKANLIFDLRLPIKPQLKKAQELLLHTQEALKKTDKLKVESPKTHLDKFAVYLRIFDGYSDNAKTREIASEIYPNDDNRDTDYPANGKVKKNYKTAKELINGGYRKHILIPE
ncbi:DUF2285 domain-containing protein [Desulfobacula toluolica]|uniref:T6SS Transcription factor RovC-like DNA binding domain-containing protein n=1 Tax=Desulfobacula toluolica (strain DSM 7467 / Tol2) TaxID=651182 RepID=K0NJJ0_DESTT|nr:DUF2285 domain-containing protein [Desulfobacula toluolica]CCK80033.1 uncharacterized protein TOL2_C18720 [Desulfobacula toluolica Tol2]